MKIALLLPLIVILGCSSAQPITELEKVVPEPLGKEALLAKVKENYSQWSSLSATFILKGKVENAEILYDGTMTGSGNSFNIVLKDPVFRSPFVSMRVNGDTVTQIDHLRDRSQSLPLDQFKWVEVFGKVFPFGFFYPILKGYPPEVIFDPTANYSLPKPSQERLTVKKQDWEAIVNFESQIMTSVFFRTMNDKEIVILAFSGKQNTARYFPGEILVTRPNSNDFIKIQFKSMKVQ